VSIDAPAFSLAHLSDPHLTSLAGASWLELVNKRILGYLSWRGKRRHVYRREVLDRVTNDMQARGVDHVAVTGDLTHIGLADECTDALGWLRSLGGAADVSVVLGNHDRYIDANWAKTVGQWQAYLEGDDGRDQSPWVRVRDSVALVGVNTAVPTGPFFATGRVGAAQCERLEAVLGELGTANLFRVVLIHHSPLAHAHIWRKRLVDGKAVLDAICRAGAELVIHGHEHAEAYDVVPTANGACVVSAVPSGSADRQRGAGWNCYRVSRDDGTWCLDIERRRYEQATEALVTASTDRYCFASH
jgi:3',5'-cyclic AMP phosphodiesterase CpdA